MLFHCQKLGGASCLNTKHKLLLKSKGELCSTNTSGIANVRKTYQDNGGWSAQVFYKDVNGKTKGKKFYFSTYGEDRAIILATEYVTQMKKLITEERTRLEQLKESMYGVC